MHILLVEKDTTIRAVVERMLKGIMEVTATGDVDEGMAFIKNYDYDLLLLGAALPGMYRAGLIKRLRKKKVDTPIIVLMTDMGGSTVSDLLDEGVDDCVRLPEQKNELAARIRAVVRRYGGYNRRTLSYGVLGLDMAAQEVKGNGTTISLTVSEYRILELLMLRRGCLLSRNMIHDHIYPNDVMMDDRTIDSHIKRIRNKLKEAGVPEYIKTRYGEGYIIPQEPEVAVV